MVGMKTWLVLRFCMKYDTLTARRLSRFNLLGLFYVSTRLTVNDFDMVVPDYGPSFQVPFL